MIPLLSSNSCPVPETCDFVNLHGKRDFAEIFLDHPGWSKLSRGSFKEGGGAVREEMSGWK